MADRQFMPPPQIPGLSAQSGSDLIQTLAEGRGGESESRKDLAAPLLAQGISLLQQAATLDPRLAPQIEQALSGLQPGSPLPNKSASAHKSGGLPTPGGRISR
jgi:hypothetical protein